MICSHRYASAISSLGLSRRHLALRTYAVAAQSRPASSKKTRSNPAAAAAKAAAPGSKPTGHIPINVGKHAPSPTAKKEHAPESTPPPQPSTLHSSAISNAPVTTKPTEPETSALDPNKLTPQQQLEQLEQIQLLQQMYPNTDVWGHFVETLDLQIPYSVKLRDRHHYSDWRAYKDQLTQNWDNYFKNAVSLWRLATADAIPGKNTSLPSWWTKWVRWPTRAIRSVIKHDGEWYQPFRNISNKTYREVQHIIAKGDPNALKKLTLKPYTEEATKLIRSRQAGLSYKWRGEEKTETKILSIRATEGYLEKDEPKIGNRMLVQMLVRYDMIQGIDIYNKFGRKLELPEETANRRVTEYFVLQKKMWYDGPWVIREQMYPKKDMPPVAA